MARGDRVLMDPGDYGVGGEATDHRISRVVDERAGIRAQRGDGDETFQVHVRRRVPTHAIVLRVSREGVPGFATLTGPVTPIRGRWRRAMMRFYDINPGRGAPLIGRRTDQTKAFALPGSAYRRKMGAEGSVRPTRLPHRLLPLPIGEPYTPRTWAYGDVKNPVKKNVEGGRVSYTNGVFGRRYKRKGR